MDEYGDGPPSCLGSAWPVGMLQPPYQSDRPTARLPDCQTARLPDCQTASAMLDDFSKIEC